MLSHQASTVRAKLDAETKRVASLYVSLGEASSSDISPIASQYLAGIALKIAEPAEHKLKMETKTLDMAPPLAVPSSGTARQQSKSVSYHASSTAKSQGSSFVSSVKDKYRQGDDIMDLAKVAEQVGEEGSSSPQQRKFQLCIVMDKE